MLMLLLACAEEEAATPTVAFLSPTDGEAVSVGDLEVTLIVEDFTLAAAKHNEGRPEGYVALSWTDGTTDHDVRLTETQGTIALGTPGAWTLTAALAFTDGDDVSETFPDYAPAVVAITVE